MLIFLHKLPTDSSLTSLWGHYHLLFTSLSPGSIINIQTTEWSNGNWRMWGRNIFLRSLQTNVPWASLTWYFSWGTLSTSLQTPLPCRCLRRRGMCLINSDLSWWIWPPSGVLHNTPSHIHSCFLTLGISRIQRHVLKTLDPMLLSSWVDESKFQPRGLVLPPFALSGTQLELQQRCSYFWDQNNSL